MWIGTPLGLAHYDGHHTRTYRPQPGDPAAIAHPYVNVGALVVAPDGIVWVGTKAGLCRIDPVANRTRCLNPTPWGDGDVHALAVAPDGSVWVGTEVGIAHVNADAQRVLDSARTPPVFAIHLASGTAYVGTTEGLRIGPRPDRLRSADGPLSTRYITSFTRTPGALWVGTFGGGVYRSTSAPQRPPDRFTAVPSTLPDARVITLDYDPADGQVWAGTWGQGALVARDVTPAFRRPEPGVAPDEPTVSATVRLGGSGRWFGTWGGLYRSPPPPPYEWIGPAEGLPAATISGLATGPDGSLWAATDRGELWQCQLSPSSCQRVPLPAGSADVTDLVWAAGALWISTFGQGVWRLSPDAAAPVLVGPPDLFAYALSASRDSLWIGTLRDGVLATTVSPGSGRVETRIPATATGPVLALTGTERGLRAVATEAKGGCLVSGRTLKCASRATPFIAIAALATARGAWVGTTDGLLQIRRAPEGAVSASHSDASLPRPDISCLLRTADGIWAATGSGIVLLDPDTGGVRLDGTAVGLPSLSFDSGACTRVGRRLAFGHRDGVLLFDPRSLPNPPNQVFLTGATVDGQFRTTGSGVTLGPDDGGPTFSFAVPLTAPHGQRVAYRLAGLQRDWTPSASGTAAYPRLSPGRYALEVRAGSAVTHLPVTVLAPMWRRPWALVLWALLAAALVAMAFRLRVQSLLRVERTRRRIADDLHDEMGSRLGALALSLDVAARTLPSASRSAMAGRADDARALLADLRDTVWVVDGSADTTAALADRIQSTAESLLPDAAVRLHLHGDPATQLSLLERRHLLYLAKEALHNAARHGTPSAVDVHLGTEPDGSVTLSIRDDGTGFEPCVDRETGRGLQSLRRRADALGGDLVLDTAPGQGASVSLRFRPAARLGWRDRVRRLGFAKP